MELFQRYHKIISVISLVVNVYKLKVQNTHRQNKGCLVMVDVYNFQ